MIDAISGNICRCTGYEPIIDAILAAAAEMRGGEERPEESARWNTSQEFFADERTEGFTTVGVERPALRRRSAMSPAARNIMPTAAFPGMLHLKMVRSPHHHARILSIDVVEGGESAGRRARAHRQGRAEEHLHDPLPDPGRAQ